MDTAKYIIYEGSKFTIEWYYTDTGKIPGLEYFNLLDKRRKVEALQLFKLMAEEGKILNITKFRHEGDGIYAFKPKPHRFLCFFFVGRKIIVTNGFEKKQDDLPKTEKERSMRYHKDYKTRIEKEDYYE